VLRCNPTHPMSTSKATTSRRVLVVDDNEDDVLLLSITLRQAHLPWKMVGMAADGEKAIDYLKRMAEDSREPDKAIDLLLLDLKMPRRTGFDVLEWVRNNMPGRFKIVVFSSSFVASDIKRARQLGANFYHVKPISSEARKQVLQELEGILGPPVVRGSAVTTGA
jgi:CheY-like chemotaxis protein